MRKRQASADLHAWVRSLLMRRINKDALKINLGVSSCDGESAKATLQASLRLKSHQLEHYFELYR
jgi:hypothetical protein